MKRLPLNPSTQLQMVQSESLYVLSSGRKAAVNSAFLREITLGSLFFLWYVG